MRTITRAVIVAAAAVPVAFLSSAPASAAESSDVAYAFDVDGSALTNTITNNSGGALNCSTSVAPAPGGVLPPIYELGGQSLYEGGEVQPGVHTQSVVDLPDGTYVALATCAGVDEGSPMWVSDYPGIADVLTLFPNESFAVQQASTIIVVPDGASVTPIVPDLGALLGSGSAG